MNRKTGDADLAARRETTQRTQSLDLSLYVITAARPEYNRTHADVAQAAISGGATIVQMRAKTTDHDAVLREARAIRTLTRAAKVPFIVNDYVEIAADADADGVHLGQRDAAAAVARESIGPGKIIGLSVKTVEQARAAARVADYVAIGPVFPTESKTDSGPPVGWDVVRSIKIAVRVPVVAIGGITSDNVLQVLETGVDGIAVISVVADAEDMEGATRLLARKIRESRETHQ